MAMRKAAVHRLFTIGLIGKSVDGGLEIVGAVLLLVMNVNQLSHWVQILTRQELSEEPHEVIARFLVRNIHHLSAGTQTFAALFLLGHGVIKVGLVIALLRQYWKAYPLAIGTFGLLVLYQIYRYSWAHSAWLLGLSLLDVFVIVITWFEYQRMRTSLDR